MYSTTSPHYDPLYDPRYIENYTDDIYDPNIHDHDLYDPNQHLYDCSQAYDHPNMDIYGSYDETIIGSFECVDEIITSNDSVNFAHAGIPRNFDAAKNQQIGFDSNYYEQKPQYSLGNFYHEPQDVYMVPITGQDPLLVSNNSYTSSLMHTNTSDGCQVENYHNRNNINNDVAYLDFTKEKSHQEKSVPRSKISYDSSQCKGRNHKKRTQCKNAALKEFIGPKPQYCAEHINLDEHCWYRKCNSAYNKEKGDKKRCREIVLKEFGLCHKHYKDAISTMVGFDGYTLCYKKLTRAREILTNLETEAETIRCSSPDLYQRKVKLIYKYRQLVDILQDHLYVLQYHNEYYSRMQMDKNLYRVLTNCYDA
eukprot:TRINITY_DN10587_c0_g1_i1.p1 TRINITY_DN10587_c0_g1~~TRINITY_DN10587_c0_g1_i1.p1  ORF type:complete len:366 (-),score=47.80 TRINITY_DN10587_c0_g1_i1:55-1152(-)